MTVYIGIDPGLSGAVAWLHDGNGESACGVVDAPVAKAKGGSEYLVGEMTRELERLCGEALECVSPGRPRAALEQGIAMPNQSSRTTYKTGRGGGLWEGLLAGLGIPYELVPPQRWKRALGLPVGADKAASRALASRLFPQLAGQFARVKDDGRAEAMLIAEWRRRQG